MQIYEKALNNKCLTAPDRQRELKKKIKKPNLKTRGTRTKKEVGGG